MFYFAKQYILWLLIIVPPVYLGLIYLFKKRVTDLSKIIDVATYPDLVKGHFSSKLDIFRATIISLCVLLLILSLARPQLGETKQKIKRQGIDVIVAIDASYSMFARDVKPDRLTKAKQLVQDLIYRLNGDRIGLIFFAGEAFVQSPLTLDYNASLLFLDLLEPGIIPVSGTAIASAIEKSRSRLLTSKGFEKFNKLLLIITDGENTSGDPLAETKKAVENNITVFTIGMGSTQGEPIPIVDENKQITGYKKDKNGEVYKSKLNEKMLIDIAKAGNGKYYNPLKDSEVIDAILKEAAKFKKRQFSVKEFKNGKDIYYWFLWPAMILILLELALFRVEVGVGVGGWKNALKI